MAVLKPVTMLLIQLSPPCEIMEEGKKNDSFKEYLISLVRARPVLYLKQEKNFQRF